MRLLPFIVALHMVAGVRVAGQEPLVAREVLRVGSVDDPKSTLSLIGGITRHAPSGRLIVLQPLDGSVVIIAPNGAVERRFGRKGRGPGEFAGQAAVGLVGDTLWVLDPSAGRISLFDLQGGFLDSWNWTVGLRMASVPLGVLRDHNLLQGGLPIEGDKVILIRTTPEGQAITAVDTIVRVGGGSIRYRGTGFSFTMRSPVSTEALRVVSGTGAYFAVVRRDAARSRTEASFRVRLFDAMARTVFDRMYAYRPQPITDAMKETVVDDAYAMLAAMPGPVSSESMRATVRRAIADSIHYPSWQPPVAEALVTDGGGVWLQREMLRTDSARWEYIDRTGRLAAAVSLPRSVKPRWADEREMCGAAEGDLGEPQVVCWRFVAAGAP